MEDQYRLLDEHELKSLKKLLIKTLIEKKMFYKFHFMGKNYYQSMLLAHTINQLVALGGKQSNG